MATFKTLRMKLLTAIAACGLALSAFAVPALAADGSTEANVTFEGGELKLVSAPNLNFGSTAITGEGAQLPASSVDRTIRVSDLRGTGAGWKLTATLSNFENEAAQASLPDATISVTGATVNNPNSAVGTAPSANQNVLLTSDDEVVEIFTAGSGAGRGVWEAVWAPANTVLNVPAGAEEVGEHVATINWSFEIAP